MDDINELKRREIELLKQIDAAGKEKAALAKQRDALRERRKAERAGGSLMA